MPAHCIATTPSPTRDGSRLLVLPRRGGARHHVTFRDLPRFLRPRSLLVLNDTRVIPARLAGRKATGGAVEVLLVRRCDAPAATRREAGWTEEWDVLARSLGTLPIGARLSFGPRLSAEIVARGERGAARLRFHGNDGRDLLAIADDIGVLPLPPYIESARRRTDAEPPHDGAATKGREDDRIRYQTVYARAPGAVAAPTAGLHFTESLLAEIAAADHEIARITLHVGPGTFRPVEVADPRSHVMDFEEYEIDETAAAAIEGARAEGRPVVAVGTTVVRTLEAVAAQGPVRAGRGRTNLFLLPGSPFRVVTELVTNFHLPRSTLLMLVSAFAGRENVLAAYEEAVERDYRFYSYGDAMFIAAEEPRS